MLEVSAICPNEKLQEYLQGRIVAKDANGKDVTVSVFCSNKVPTSMLPDDFISIEMNGSVYSLGKDIDFASGYLMITLYVRLNQNGTVKDKRISKLLAQIDSLVDKANTGGFFYRYDSSRILMPSYADQAIGYSTTILNLYWTTTSNFNNQNSIENGNSNQQN